jgi:hypothetical protein
MVLTMLVRLQEVEPVEVLEHNSPSFGLTNKMPIAPAGTIHRGAAAFFQQKAGLQTFLHLETPSHPNGQWLGCFAAITEFTAAGQSEILTHIPN